MDSPCVLGGRSGRCRSHLFSVIGFDSSLSRPVWMTIIGEGSVLVPTLVGMWTQRVRRSTFGTNYTVPERWPIPPA